MNVQLPEMFGKVFNATILYSLLTYDFTLQKRS